MDVSPASLVEYNYRHFFRTGVAVVLTVGCLWGAISLLQIALAGIFLQLRLLSSIHGSCPRHNLRLGWNVRDGLRLSIIPRIQKHGALAGRPGHFEFLSLAGRIVADIPAEMLLRSPISLALGALSGALEITSVLLFMVVLHRTASQAVGPRNPYEKFLTAS